jgi:hypothetical protein
MYLFHFFIYNLAGLYYITNGIYNKRSNDSVLFDDKTKLVNIPTNISNPIKIHMKNIIPFQREAFEIIKDKFELIEDLNTIKDYEIVSIYGCVAYGCDSSMNYQSIYLFLRNLFFENMKYSVIPGKRVYITRKNSELQHNGTLKRYIFNENEFIESLKKFNIEFIQLEEYNTFDKIKLFMESEIIISPHSGCLTFLLFTNKKTNIIEILKNGTTGSYHNNYLDLCKDLGLQYNRYSNINEDYNGNFNMNIKDFEIFLAGFII